MTQCVSSLVQMSVFFWGEFTEEKDLEWTRGERLSKGVEERERERERPGYTWTRKVQEKYSFFYFSSEDEATALGRQWMVSRVNAPQGLVVRIK